MQKLMIGLAFAAALPLYAADKPKATPQLTGTEKIALASVQEQAQSLARQEQQLRAEAQTIAGDVAKENPGYHLDLSTLQIVKDAKK